MHAITHSYVKCFDVSSVSWHCSAFSARRGEIVVVIGPKLEVCQRAVSCEVRTW